MAGALRRAQEAEHLAAQMERRALLAEEQLSARHVATAPRAPQPHSRAEPTNNRRLHRN